jgi:hypothetical protein
MSGRFNIRKEEKLQEEGIWKGSQSGKERQ